MSATPLGARDRLFLNRFSFGHTNQLAKQVHSAGGGRAWFEKQLHPGSIKDTKGNQVKAWFPDVWYSPSKLYERNESGVANWWEVMPDLARWTMMRRVYSSHQLHEVMVDFWSNLLHVPLGDDYAWVGRVDYDKLIRKHALGKFDDMLVKAITHPAMGLSLDNAFSTKDAPNENLGRELLELHTVGVDGGYTERDVKNSSRMLTGYRVDMWPTYKKHYEPDDHWTGTIKVLGFKSTNRSKDGRKATEKYLRYLAHHPKTAKRIAQRLCVKFVHDNPSSGLVKHVAAAWTHSGTDIKATLRAMVSHPEFLGSANQKVRSPLEETLATIRALGIKPHKPTDDNAFARALYWSVSGQGMTPYGWPAPNGFPEVNVAWSSPGRALDSLNAQLRYASLASWGTGGWLTTDVGFKSYHSFLPPLPARFGSVINHVSITLLGEPATPRMKDGIALRTGIGLNRRVGRSAMDDNRVKQILIALLGTPAHLTR
ncbi:DUF1800 domain-containing protein [Nocardioides sp.]|uniref:DUF1800 domain-containing protein n=1 Tax=Nocardioides sp. TaxID=35761 RepID=UPI0035276B61